MTLGWGWGHVVTHAEKRTGPGRDSELPWCGGSLWGYFGYGDVNRTSVRAREMLGSGWSLEGVAWVGCRAMLHKRQRAACGQLETGGGDEMPFASHHEPPICGQRNTISLWAAEAGVAPGSCLQLHWLSSSPDLRLPLLESPLPGLSCLGLCRLKSCPPGLPSVWEK